MNFFYRKTDIPDKFYSEDSHKPFQLCVSCQETLDEKRYYVEKAFRKYPFDDRHEVIFEYAICENCAQKKNNELSEESKENILAYFEEHAKSQDPLTEDEEVKVDKCMVSQENLEDCDEFVIYGFFEGNQMLHGMFPYGLSGSVLDQISDLLSEKTLGEMDDFIGEHFGGPPEFRQILKDKKWSFV